MKIPYWKSFRREKAARPERSFEVSALVLVALNLIDAASTHLSLVLDLAYEVNPLMRWAFDASPALFWVLKLSLVGIGLTIIAALAADHAKRIVSTLNCVYGAVIAIHLLSWIAYLIVTGA